MGRAKVLSIVGGVCAYAEIFKLDFTPAILPEGAFAQFIVRPTGE